MGVEIESINYERSTRGYVETNMPYQHPYTPHFMKRCQSKAAVPQ